ncbi:MAG: BREX system P-loop protein BrxC, partial [Gammaproteobacteria bacterium]|nr:BREX system P-loop protein BrxC [Gammaproteobacteria bacterium]
QDIEQEIKDIEVDSQKLSDELETLIYDGVLKTRKIRFDENNYDYSYSRRLDDTLTGREYELAINVITSFHDYHGVLEKHKTDTLFNDELRILLPASDRLVRDLIMYKQTEKYVAHETKTVRQKSIKRILGDKRDQNVIRLNDLKILCAKLVGTAKFFVAGQELELSGEDGQSKMIRAFHELIKRTYPNLKMLRGVHFTENQIADIMKDAGQGLFTDDATLGEYQQEVLSFIQSNSRGGVRTTVKSLLAKFETKPYGWSFAAVLCALTHLCGRGKVEVSESTNLLDDADLVRALRNTAAHGNLILDPQVEFTPSQLRWVKDFYKDYFEKMTHATEAKALAKEVQTGFETQATSLDKLLAQAEQYPFLRALMPVVAALQELKGKPYTWIMAELKNQEDSWFDHKENVIDPIVKFMKGPQKGTYDGAKQLLNTQKPNLSYLELESADSESKVHEQIAAALQAPDVYKGNHIQQLKALTESVTAQLTALLKQEQKIAANRIEALGTKLKSFDQFKSLNNDQQEELLKPFDQSNKHLTQQTLVAVIRDETRCFEDETYSDLVQNLMVWSRPAPTPKPKSIKPVPTPIDGSIDGCVAEVVEAVEVVEPVTVAPITVKANQLSVNFTKPWLETEEDVQAYVNEYKKVLLAELKAGKQIQL